jgi:hypothetical protein
MFDLIVSATGKNTSDLVDGLNEVIKDIENGFACGFNGGDNRDYCFDISTIDKDKNAYYAASILERNGEYVYTKNIVFELSKRASPEKRLNEIVKAWYETTDIVKDGNGYYFNCGEVYVEGQSCKNIDKKTYELLKNYL